MLKCEVGKDIDCKLELTGTLLDAVTDICNIVQGVHSMMVGSSPVEAIIFRSLLLKAIDSPDTFAPVERKSDK